MLLGPEDEAGGVYLFLLFRSGREREGRHCAGLRGGRLDDGRRAEELYIVVVAWGGNF